MLVQRAGAGREAGSEEEGGKRPGQAVGGGDHMVHHGENTKMQTVQLSIKSWT